MNRAALWRMVAPLFATSVLLVVLGGFAAWHVHHQQVGVSELVANDVHAMVLGHDLYIEAREVRHLLNQYLRLDDEASLGQVRPRLDEFARLQADSRRLAREPEQEENLTQVEAGYAEFLRLFDVASKSRDRALLQELADRRVNELLLGPANESLQTNERLVERTNARNRQHTRTVAQGLLLLGVCGAVAGAIAGVALTRALRRTFWQLHVSVSGAMEKLETIVGPFPTGSGHERDALPAQMKEVESRVEQVVTQLQAREREVLHHQQLAAMGRLAAALAHEMRNPLTPIKMLVQMAQDRPGGTMEPHELKMIERETIRLEQSIQSFLEFSRPPVVQKIEGDVCRTVLDACELVAARCRSQQVDLDRDLPAAGCAIRHDPAQIKQVVLNLLLNALDVTPSGKRVRVSLRPQFSDFHLPGASPDLIGAWLRVRDEGPGIDADQRERIFEPFATTKEHGTGLGLAICRRIIEAHGGRITARSEPGGGAIFDTWLPTQGEPWRGPTGETVTEGSATGDAPGDLP